MLSHRTRGGKPKNRKGGRGKDVNKVVLDEGTVEQTDEEPSAPMSEVR